MLGGESCDGTALVSLPLVGRETRVGGFLKRSRIKCGTVREEQLISTRIAPDQPTSSKKRGWPDSKTVVVRVELKCPA